MPAKRRDMPVKVAVIGVGYLGRHHARVYSELDSATLVAVADPDRVRAEEIAAAYGCRAYADFREALPLADAVSIVTPTTFHHGIALECIRAGKDILIEKPITVSLAEADSLIEAAEKAGVIVQVGHLERFNPAIVALMRLIENPVFIEARRLSPFQGRGTDVDITLDLMIHDIDIILALVKRAGGPHLTEIRAAGARLLTSNIDSAHAWLEFGEHCAASLTANRTSSDKGRTLTVYQNGHCLSADYQVMELRRFSGKGENLISETLPVLKSEPLKEELRHFLQCTVNRGRPEVSAEEGRNALDLSLMIGEKIRKHWRA